MKLAHRLILILCMFLSVIIPAISAVNVPYILNNLPGGPATLTYIDADFTALANAVTTINSTACPLGGTCTITAQPASGVTQIIAGTGITISPTSGSGVVTINSTATGSISGVSITGESGVSQVSNSITAGIVNIVLGLANVPNSALQYSSTTVNGVSCALGGTCTISGGSGSGTVTPSSQYAVAYYPSASNVVSGVPAVANALLATNASGIPAETAITSIFQPISGTPVGGTMFYEDSGAAAIDLLRIGTNGYVLTSNGSTPYWAAGGGGSFSISGVQTPGDAIIFDAASNVGKDAGGALVTLSGTMTSGDILYAINSTTVGRLNGSGCLQLNGASAPTAVSCGSGSFSISGVQNVNDIITFSAVSNVGQDGLG